VAGELDGLIAKLDAIAGIGGAIAADAAPGVQAVARKTAAAHTDPEGNAWKPTKDGRAALPRAPGAVTAVVSGTTTAVITLILKGVYIFHQRSKSKGKKGLPRRLILDVESVPPAIAEVISASAKRVLGRTMEGRR
jgi:hypothetical protein